jgi:hypothetical protein
VQARARPFHDIIKFWVWKIQRFEENLKVHVQQTTFWLLLLQVNNLHPCTPKEGRKEERKEDYSLVKKKKKKTPPDLNVPLN